MRALFPLIIRGEGESSNLFAIRILLPVYIYIHPGPAHGAHERRREEIDNDRCAETLFVTTTAAYTWIPITVHTVQFYYIYVCAREFLMIILLSILWYNIISLLLLHHHYDMLFMRTVYSDSISLKLCEKRTH